MSVAVKIIGPALFVSESRFCLGQPPYYLGGLGSQEGKRSGRSPLPHPTSGGPAERSVASRVSGLWSGLRPGLFDPPEGLVRTGPHPGLCMGGVGRGESREPARAPPLWRSSGSKERHSFDRSHDAHGGTWYLVNCGFKDFSHLNEPRRLLAQERLQTRDHLK